MYYKDADLVILDESTNGIDDINEKLIFENLKRIKEEKIILVISHKMKTLKYCEKVLNLKNGFLKLLN